MLDPNSNTQPKMRRNYNVIDQWGRKWLVSVEKSTGQPCGGIDACFTDPLGTPPQYLALDPENPRLLTIDYARWIGDLNQAAVEYDVLKTDVGRQLYGERFNPAKAPTPEMMRIIGKPPRAVDQIERAAAGDRELLGLPPLTEDAKPKRQPKPAEV